MRKLTQLFLLLVFCALLVVPTINVFSSPHPLKVKWKKKSLYNMDFALHQLTAALYQLGISTEPGNVVVGLDGWLFLGNDSEHVISDGREGFTPKTIAQGEKIGAAAAAWENWLYENGVKLYRVMIGPNKGTVYPEQMPFWARPLPPNATDALLKGTGSTRYVDLRGVLKEAKTSQAESLYFKTDTHWNSLGAGIAFQAFAKSIEVAAPELRWPSEDTYRPIRVEPRSGNDLISYFRLKLDVAYPSPVVALQELPVETTRYEFNSKSVIGTGGNPEMSIQLGQPVLVRSQGALNNKRVLWLRDSFGVALSPLMAATFNEVLHVHWMEAFTSDGRLAELVHAWKPDYVFVTVVERFARSDFFTTLPPPIERCLSACTRAD